MCNKRNYSPIWVRGKYIKVDECIAEMVERLNDDKIVKTLGSCCGHNVYPATLVVERSDGSHEEMFSGIKIPRQRNFYRKDKKGLYFIPETIGRKY